MADPERERWTKLIVDQETSELTQRAFASERRTAALARLWATSSSSMREAGWRWHAHQDVCEVGDGVGVVGLAGGDERVEAGRVLAGVVGADKQAGSSCGPGRPRGGALGGVCVDRQVRVGQEERECVPLAEGCSETGTATCWSTSGRSAGNRPANPVLITWGRKQSGTRLKVAGRRGVGHIDALCLFARQE